MDDITYAVSIDVNNPTIPYNVYVASVLDSNVRYLEITLYQNGNVIALSNTATATASLVTDNVLVNDSVNCTIQDNIITVPLEDLQRHGNLDVQVTVTEGTKVLAIPFPIQVRVTPNIAENAQIDENSLGSYAEVVHEIAEARGTYTTLHDALSAKAPLSTAYTFDSTTTNVVYNVANPKTIYLNATVDGEKGIVLTSADNTVQYFFGASKSVKVRNKNGASTYTPWELALEKVGNKKNIINSTNLSSTEFYPSIKAVADYLTANYLGSGNNTVSWVNLATAVQTLINGKENTSNKLTSQTGIDSTSTDTEYPTAKAVYDLGVDILDDVSGDLVLKENLSNKKTTITGYETSNQFYPTIKALVDYVAANYENLSNKLSSEEGIDSSSTDTEYPSAKAVYDLGVEILALVNDDISNVESRLVLKESFSNKKNAIAGNETSEQYYPSTKAVADALSTKAPLSTAYTFDAITRNVVYDANNPKKIYTRAIVNGKDAFVLTTANNYYQIALCYDGTEYKRELTAGGAVTYTEWALVNDIFAGVDPENISQIVENYIEEHGIDLTGVERTKNRVTAITAQSDYKTYPTAGAVYDYAAPKSGLNYTNNQLSQLTNEVNQKADKSDTYTFDTTTTEVPFDVNNPKIIYLNAVVDGESGIVITSARNASNASFQIFFGRNGTTKIRYFTGGTSYSDWFQVTELVGNKKNSITASNRTSTNFYPSIKAVVDYLASTAYTKSEVDAAIQTAIGGVENGSY